LNDLAAAGMAGDHHLREVGEQRLVAELRHDRVDRGERTDRRGCYRIRPAAPAVAVPDEDVTAEPMGLCVIIGQELWCDH